MGRQARDAAPEVALTRATPGLEHLERAGAKGAAGAFRSQVDTSLLHVDNACMPTRSKRTYSLQPATVARVRELAARYGSSQDAVVDRAVEELDRVTREKADAFRWAEASRDPMFLAEAAEIAAALDERDRWPA